MKVKEERGNSGWLKIQHSNTKIMACIVKAMAFPVVMYGYERWTIKKAEHQRIDAFELWCGRRLVGVSLTAKRLKQSILKEINPEHGTTDAETPIVWPSDVKS